MNDGSRSDSGPEELCLDTGVGRRTVNDTVGVVDIIDVYGDRGGSGGSGGRLSRSLMVE